MSAPESQEKSSPKPGTFKKGSGAEKDSRIAHGGKREGAGRKPDWYKRECERLIRSNRLLERLGKLAAGKAIEVQTTQWVDGKKKKDGTPGPKVQKLITERHAAKFDTQIYAVDKLMERAWGKPRQEIEHIGGALEIDIVGLIQKAEEERGLRRPG